MIKIDNIDDSGLRRQISEMIAIKRDIPKVIKSTARQIAGDCIRLTPPFGQAPATETFGDQRNIGRAAVERDIRRTMQPLNALTVATGEGKDGKRVTATINRLKRDGNWEELSLVISKVLHKDVKVIGVADPKLHTSQRLSSGRVKKSYKTPTFVANAPSLNQYIKSEQSKVGMAKSGWNAAVEVLGVPRIPDWIRSKGGAGTCVDSTSSWYPKVEFSNDVPFIQQKGRELSITKRACLNRERNMKREIQAILDARVRKANASA